MAHCIKGALAMQMRTFFQRGPRLFCTKSLQEVNKFAQTDLLLNNLKNASNTKSVLDMVSQHNGIMNNRHIMQALRTLFTLQKSGSSELSTNEILAHRDFRRLCRKLRFEAGGIELPETIEALKVVSYVGVAPDSTIFQILLQLIRHNINNLSLQQIIFLDFILSQTSSSPLADALKIALPIVFEINLPIKMDHDNLPHLAECLFFASRHRLTIDSVEKIVTALLKCSDYDVKTAKSIVWSICDLETNEIFRPLLRQAINCLIVHSDDLLFSDLEITLKKLVLRYSRKSDYFYDETFYDTCGNYVVDKDLGYREAIFMLRKFSRVNYFHRFLLDYLSIKVDENPSLLSHTHPMDFYGIVQAASMTDYRPIKWDTMKNLIAKSENVANSDQKQIIWIKFAAGLCLLDIFKVDVLSKCLSEPFLKQLFSKQKFMSDFENYSTVWQSIKLYKPELHCLLNKEYSPEKLSRQYRPLLEFPLEAALHKALGGQGYVKTDLHSKYGIQIDHAVVFRKGGYPVAMNFNENLEFIEDIEVPHDNYLVAILGLRPYNYTLNNKHLRASCSLNFKVLELQGVQVVPIDLELWEGLPDFEKIPYIMRTIKERTVSDLHVSESVI